jgi:hypothetical protein
MPANRGISALMAFPTFQEIYSGCCTEVTACIRTRSGMIVIRPAAWRPFMRASSWVNSANFVMTEFYEVHARPLQLAS